MSLVQNARVSKVTSHPHCPYNSSNSFKTLLRWLLARGHVDELAIILEKASVWNSRSLPTNFKKTLSVSQTVSDRRVSIFDLFQKGYKLTTLLMTIIWFSIILTYFGITLHMSTLGGNIYINTVSFPITISSFFISTSSPRLRKRENSLVWKMNSCFFY